MGKKIDLLYDLERARELDGRDLLAGYRSSFYQPEGKLYFDGNSLGLLSKPVEKATIDALDQWKNKGIQGWVQDKDSWFTLAEKVSTSMGASMGAQENEIAATATTTINLHQFLHTFYQPHGTKTKIVIDELNFPSDRYAVESFLQSRSLSIKEHVRCIASNDGLLLRQKDIIEALDETVQVAVLPSVLFCSGQLLDCEAISKHCAALNIKLCLDCSHSAGAMPHQLHEWGVDFATWCGYKYLNGGPGAVAFLFVHEKHHGQIPGMTGWWGYKKDQQFAMHPHFVGSHGANAWQVSTPNILSLAGLHASINQINEVGMHSIRKKSLALTRFLMDLISEDHELNTFGIAIINPIKDQERGGHVALQMPFAWPINLALIDNGMITDFRHPNIIRVAPVALYTRFADVWQFVHCLKSIIVDESFKNYENQYLPVT